MRCTVRQKGFSLATALFVITVMAVLAGVILQLVRSNAQSSGEEIQLIRAFYAAQSGIQFGLNVAFPPDGSATSCTAETTYPDFDFIEDGLNACSAEVTCSPLVVSSSTYYTISSTGTCGEVSRTIQVRAQ